HTSRTARATPAKMGRRDLVGLGFSFDPGRRAELSGREEERSCRAGVDEKSPASAAAAEGAAGCFSVPFGSAPFPAVLVSAIRGLKTCWHFRQRTGLPAASP